MIYLVPETCNTPHFPCHFIVYINKCYLFFHHLHLHLFLVDEKRKSKSTPVILAEIAKEEGL